MEELGKKWLARANNDLKTAKDEMNTEDPATDTICFHAQQCVEKYLKGYLVLHQKHFRKTHNVSKLVELCKDIEPDFETLHQFKVDILNNYAVEIRYAENFTFPQ